VTLNSPPAIIKKGDDTIFFYYNSPQTLMPRRRIIYPIVLALLVGISFLVWQFDILHTHGKPLIIQLSRGPFQVLEFSPRKPPVLGIVLFASGDGGWSRLEESICHGLQKHGYDVIGIDSTVYARTDYDLARLQADFNKLARTAEAPYQGQTLPLIVGGFSMGAAQAIAVAGGPNPPPGLTGLLVVEPLSRGRYGLRTSDKVNVLPTGPGTFAVADFARTMGNIRVVQWHAELDTIDSRAWLAKLTVPHEEYDFPEAGHSYRHDRDQFVRELVDSTDQLLTPVKTGGLTARSGKP
jgi:pimeloyl-ACP methyl ester carboxylesterase